MCIKVEKDGVVVTTLKEERTEMCGYTLYSLSIGGIERYLINATSDGDTDIQMVGGTKAQAEELFQRICDSEISCHHLEDVADDYRKQIKYVSFKIFNL